MSLSVVAEEREMRIVGRHYKSGLPVQLDVENGHVVAIKDLSMAEELLERLPWIAPGIVDLQINGFAGREFTDAELTETVIAELSCALDADGVTSYLPTCTTHSSEMLTHAFQTLAEAVETVPEVRQRVAGFHLEGPYISPEQGPRGAHPQEHCRRPDWDEFQRLQEVAGGMIRLVTLSPEYDNTTNFINKVVANGVVVAIGHTNATSCQIQAAVDAGATMSTHLGNGAHAQIQRHPNYIWDQLADDRLTASLIVDGHHLPEAVVKSFVRSKTVERCFLVSDIVGMAGMPAGRYRNSSIGDVELLEDGRLVVGGQREYLAGATLPITVGIAKVMEFANLALEDAIEMATRRPAEIIGETAGDLAVGAVADLILFELPLPGEDRIAICATVNAGEVVFGEVSVSL